MATNDLSRLVNTIGGTLITKFGREEHFLVTNYISLDWSGTK